MKTKVLKLWFCFLFALVCSAQIFSQEENTDTTFTVDSYYTDEQEYNEPSNINFLNVGLGALNPKNAFGQKLDKSLFHLNFSYFRQIKKYKPFFAGFEFGYSHIDSYNADIEILTDEGFTEYWNEAVNSNLYQFNLIGRYYLPARFWKIDPFVEFNYGLQWFSTTSRLDVPDSEDSESESVKNDLVGKYGFAAGFNLMVTENYYGFFRIGYDAGLSAYYYTLKEEFDLPLEYTIDAFDLQKSTTDVLKWDIGFTFAF